MKVSDLDGALLDYWVAKAEGIETAKIMGGFCYSDPMKEDGAGSAWFHPSTSWAQGGPIIEQEGIAIQRNDSGSWNAGIPAKKSSGHEYWAHCQYSATSPLIAAMRAYVASKFGDTVPDL